MATTADTITIWPRRTWIGALLLAAALGTAACADLSQEAADREAAAEELLAEAEEAAGAAAADGASDASSDGGSGDTTADEGTAGDGAAAGGIDPAQAQQAALDLSQCMRDQGVEFPDISISEEGGIDLSVALQTIDPDQAGFPAALEACSDHLEKLDLGPLLAILGG